MQGTPREVFSRVDEMMSYRLDVPQAARIAWELRRRGIPLSEDIIRNEELVENLCRLKSEI